MKDGLSRAGLFRLFRLRRLAIYWAIFLPVGFALQLSSPIVQVARFQYDWQVLSCYGLFLVPLAVLIRGLPAHQQYAYSVMAIGPLEVVGFWLGSSQVYPGNFVETIVGTRSFCLTLVLVFGWMPYLGNLAVERVEGWAASFARPMESSQ